MMDNKLESLLAARDLRWRLRLSMASISTGCLITVTLRVPWKYRVSQDFIRLMEKLCNSLENMLTSRGISIDDRRWITGEDGPALFLSLNSDADRTKHICIEAEESLPGGQLLDIDVMARDGNALSREMLGFPPRKCFVCDNPATACASRKLHSPQALAAALEKYYNEAVSCGEK